MKTKTADRVGNPDVHIPAEVIRTLGRVAVLGLVGSFALVLFAVTSRYELDAVKATLISSFMALGGSAGVALGAILATTGKGAPQPVTVEQPAGQPVPTKDVAPDVQPAADSEFGHIDVGTALVVLIVALVVLAVLGLI